MSLYIRWPKYWSFSFSISPSNKCSGLIFFRIDWFDLLAVQGAFRSPPTPQFESISSLTFSFLYGLNLTSIYDYWKSHRLLDLCWQSDVSALFYNKLLTALPSQDCWEGEPSWEELCGLPSVGPHRQAAQQRSGLCSPGCRVCGAQTEAHFFEMCLQGHHELDLSLGNSRHTR